MNIPVPKFNKTPKWSMKAYAMLVFENKASAVAFRKVFRGANYDAGYIGERGIEKSEEYGGYVLAIRIEHGGRNHLMRAVGFIECQLLQIASREEMPKNFLVWSV